MSDDEHTARVQAWVDGYLQAWNSNDPDTIGALFTEGAAYFTEPHSRPWRGRAEIVRQWLHRKDDPGETQFRWHPLTVSVDAAPLECLLEASGSWWAPRSSNSVSAVQCRS
jgi:uncharacterized protein (TIGR02246 family)